MFMRVNSRCAHQVRPPPSTRDPNEGVPAGYGRGDRLTEGVCEDRADPTLACRRLEVCRMTNAHNEYTIPGTDRMTV